MKRLLPDGDAIGIVYVDGVPTDDIEVILSVPGREDLSCTTYEYMGHHGIYIISFYADQGDIASFQVKIGDEYFTPVPPSFVVDQSPPHSYENNLYVRTVPPYGSPRTAYGWCYIDGQKLPLDGKNLILAFPGQAVNAAIFPQDPGYFIFDFMEEDNVTGQFYITHNGTLYMTVETITTLPGIIEYMMDLHFYTVPISCDVGVPEPRTVRGYCYIDNQLMLPDELTALYLTLPGQTRPAVLFRDISYFIFDFAECQDTTGSFTMVYNGETYAALETVTIQQGVWIYNIDLHFFTVPPELCSWVDAKGGPTALAITDVFEMVDSYLNQTPPTGYSFIPTLQNLFGVIDYYLGFNGDAATGCDFYP